MLASAAQMNFFSDNTSAMAPQILAAIQAANEGAASSYGEDTWTELARQRFRETFENELEMYPVGTGTAANALALGTLTPPYGAILCHPESHINVHQCGAPEFYTAGAKLLPVDGPSGKVELRGLIEALENAGTGGVHAVQPTVLSLTQTTDFGAVYTPDELRALSATAHEQGLLVHMDGARFANAVAASEVSPAELSWRSGIDILCFGASKNGALAAEAILVFKSVSGSRDFGQDLGFRRKRGGHLVSKMRFLSAQLECSLRQGLWLRLAENANTQARYLAEGLEKLREVEILHPVESNMLWLRLPESWAQGLEDRGYPMMTWPSREAPGKVTTRWVTAWNTRRQDVESLLQALADLG